MSICAPQHINEQLLWRIANAIYPLMNRSLQHQFFEMRKQVVMSGWVSQSHGNPVKVLLKKGILRLLAGPLNILSRNEDSQDAANLDDSRSSRGSVAYLVPYDIYNPVTGGAVRVHELAKRLSSCGKVYIISLAATKTRVRVKAINPLVTLISIPGGDCFRRQCDCMVSRYADMAPLICAAEYYHLCKDLMFILNGLRCTIRHVVLVGPYWLGLVQNVFPATPILYDAHDVNRDFAGMICGVDGQAREEIEAQVAEYEKALCDKALHLWCVSENDRRRFISLYNLDSEKASLVKNGVDFNRCIYTDGVSTSMLKSKLNWEQPVAVFTGAYHKPNLEAVAYICSELAPQAPHVLFVIVGIKPNDADAFLEHDNVPANVQFLGVVDEVQLEAVYAISDYALAPMNSGCGASLKIPQYIAHGKVVLATPFAIRGYEQLSDSVVVSELSEYVSTFLGLIASDDSLNDRSLNIDSMKAYHNAKAFLDWNLIAENAVTTMV